MTLRTRLFHFWFRLRRPMTLGVRALAFNAQGRLLLVRHSYVPGWHLPGGGVEAGDTLEETLAKELMEETNAQLCAAPRLLSVHFNRQTSRRDHVALYHCPCVRQDEAKAADLEILEAGFFALDDLPDGVTPATLRRIAEWRGDAPISPDW